MISVDNNKCSGCGLCLGDCVGGSLKLVEQKAVLNGRCIQCGHCVAICPENAVAIPEYDMADIQGFEESFRLNPAALLGVIKFRRSIRRFTSRKIEPDKLAGIIQAGRYTATGSNAQACRFILVQDDLPVLKKMVWQGVEACLSGNGRAPEMADYLRQFIGLREKSGIDYLFRDAPAVLYIAAPSAIDAGLAAQNMELMAAAQGLGVLFNGFVARLTSMNEKARAWLEAGDKPIAAAMLLGYPAVRYQRTAPRKAADVVFK